MRGPKPDSGYYDNAAENPDVSTGEQPQEASGAEINIVIGKDVLEMDEAELDELVTNYKNHPGFKLAKARLESAKKKEIKTEELSKSVNSKESIYHPEFSREHSELTVDQIQSRIIELSEERSELYKQGNDTSSIDRELKALIVLEEEVGKAGDLDPDHISRMNSTLSNFTPKYEDDPIGIRENREFIKKHSGLVDDIDMRIANIDINNELKKMILMMNRDYYSKPLEVTRQINILLLQIEGWNI